MRLSERRNVLIRVNVRLSERRNVLIKVNVRLTWQCANKG